MIDIHTHILPQIDDGSSSVEESVEMLRLSYHAGVKKIIATPHFYASKETPAQFLKRRDTAWNLLAVALPKDVPEIWLGAEVYYYTGIARSESLRQFCIGETNVLLLEMPFHRWTGGMIDEMISIARDTDITVLVAHIDRYLPTQKPEVWDVLAEAGVLFQVNASFFLENWRSRRKALRLLRDDRIAALGSDCHNMKNRKPNLADAITVIQNKEGLESVVRLTERTEILLGQKFVKM